MGWTEERIELLQRLWLQGQTASQIAEQHKGWFAFDPKPDRFGTESGFDLRGLER